MPKNDLLEELEKFDRESAQKLNELLSIVARHKRVYSGSKDPAITQLWLAVLEIYSRQEKLNKQIAQLSRPEPVVFSEGNDSKLSKFLKKKKETSDILETLQNY